MVINILSNRSEWTFYFLSSVQFNFTISENIIFRVIEETVTNSLRHGHATKIWIKCTSNNSSYILSIHNNGKSETHIKPGYGITQMRERLTIINGTVEFDGKKGFTTVVKFPKVGV